MKTKDRDAKTNRNEPENEAEKLLKTLECIKNEPERTEKRTEALPQMSPCLCLAPLWQERSRRKTISSPCAR